MYSIAEENYIKSIYHLQRSNDNVGTNELAADLKTKPASVTDMIKKLQAKGLLQYEKYYGCQLTASGKALALSIIRRHRLWEYFLSEKLGFGWEEVHDVAEQLEHIKSSLLTEKLDAYLGFPRFDPHGDPIPDKQGKMISVEWQNLNEAPVGKTLKIMGVASQTQELLEMLSRKNLSIGAQLKITQRFSFDQSIEIELDGASGFNISERLAGEVLVKTI
ncbi:MAG TPA: metal-dependent transcriptional regulator [Phnomibacter sp.]|nr:metal-dependent transcriptional regulator [Phnomibacter sp.]